jgi:hypothetical protein
MTEYGFPVFTLCSVVLDLLPLTQDVSGTQAYTFILWHKLTGGLQRRWANRPLNTFVKALETFRTAMSFRFFEWLTENRDVFAAYKASLGLVWA